MTGRSVWAVLLAGGAGTRFWPLSRAHRPKQMLALVGGQQPLLVRTAARIRPLVPDARMIVVTAAHLVEATRALLPAVPSSQVLGEPVGRNTAAAVALAAWFVVRRDADALLAVFPADHHVGDEPALRDAVARALSVAAQGELVTLGLRPTRAETGYGYIEVGEPLADGAHRARAFVEKPDAERAARFVAAGTHLWNSGMFFFSARAILDAIDRHLPVLGTALRELQGTGDPVDPTWFEGCWRALPSVSIDHGVFEKHDRVAVVPVDPDWSDVGSYQTAWELESRDAQGNAAPSDAVLLDAHGNYVRAPQGKLVALVGVDDLVVVDTEDALLVVPRARAQDVRLVVERLRARGDRRI
ncbi:MAG: sugar phosphate nucleotidyltransferase [Myxococcota bacterium]|nr:sugar phosphate nucleotidyltransferase [Myxococcota bacterium]MDW8361208.1 mannose-1-phosphate guanylyltransferase [Myxococcales bacterium]